MRSLSFAWFHKCARSSEPQNGQHANPGEKLNVPAIWPKLNKGLSRTFRQNLRHQKPIIQSHLNRLKNGIIMTDDFPLLDLSHLTLSAQKIALLPNNERIQRIRSDRWIGYPRALDSLNR